MDRKSIIVLVVCFIVLMLWYPLVVNKLYPPKPLAPGSTNAPSATLTTTNPPGAVPVAPVTPEVPVATVPRPVASTNVQETTLEVTNSNGRYTFTSHGGGLKEV